MTTTPPAAKVPNDDDLMEIDAPAARPGEEADVESEGASALQKGKPQTPEAQENGSKTPVQIIDDDDEEGDEDGDEETFAVEKILNHRIRTKLNGQKGFQFLIKWLGYNKPEDNTWEDEENCEGSHQLIATYWDSIGGKPTLSAAKPGRKRNISTPLSDRGTDRTKKRRQETSEDSTPVPASKAISISAWRPPADLESWDEKVAAVETVEKTDNGMVLVYLLWKNGRKSVHDTTVIYQKCPQRMLQFYESHLVFKQEDPAPETDQ